MFGLLLLIDFMRVRLGQALHCGIMKWEKQKDL